MTCAPGCCGLLDFDRDRQQLSSGFTVIPARSAEQQCRNDRGHADCPHDRENSEKTKHISCFHSGRPWPLSRRRLARGPIRRFRMTRSIGRWSFEMSFWLSYDEPWFTSHREHAVGPPAQYARCLIEGGATKVGAVQECCGFSGTSLSLSAIRPSSGSERALIFRIALLRWTFTVASAMPISPAICLLRRPRAT
jgi:hypothetical protein